MEFKTWLIYLVAAAGLSLSPGPNSLLALTHGALYGKRMALNTIAGGAVGFVSIVGLSMLGIGALLETSLTALTVMKWVGGVYLVWLGIQVWRAPGIQLAVQPGMAGASAVSLFRQGLLSALTNPKAILFFAAFLPQFIDPARSLVVQFAVMAATFAIMECITELALVLLASKISGWLSRVARGFNRGCGAIFMAIGVWLPLRG